MYYHLIIGIEGVLTDIVRLDLREKQLEEMVLTPYHNGTPLQVQGKTIPLEQITKLIITRTSDSSGNIKKEGDIWGSINPNAYLNQSERRRIAESGEDVTGEFITVPPGSNKLAKKEAQKEMKRDARKVFVVHGRDERLRRSIFEFLTAIRLDPIEWPEAISSTGEGSPYVGKALKILNIAQAIVVLLTPDDMVQLREGLWKDNEPQFEKQLSGQPRPNVLIELGMALAINEAATIIVQVGQIKDISDIKGRHILHLDNSAPQKHQLANRLKVAGCEVKTVGSDWLSAGDFEAPVIEKAAEIETPVNDYTPTDMDEKVMIVIGYHYDNGRTIDELHKVIKFSKQALRLILDNLVKSEFISWDRSDMERWGAYHLEAKGREYLSSRNLL